MSVLSKTPMACSVIMLTYVQEVLHILYGKSLNENGQDILDKHKFIY